LSQPAPVNFEQYKEVLGPTKTLSVLQVNKTASSGWLRAKIISSGVTHFFGASSVVIVSPHLCTEEIFLQTHLFVPERLVLPPFFSIIALFLFNGAVF
jgi:hypothetical protein